MHWHLISVVCGEKPAALPVSTLLIKTLAPAKPKRTKRWWWLETSEVPFTPAQVASNRRLLPAY